MKRLEIIYAVVTLGALGSAAALPFFAHRKGGPASLPGWQAFVQPGPLSAKHAFLSDNCAACHTPHAGPTADKCIACHASAEALLARQPSRFHADLGESPGDCRGCHVEHMGVGGAAHRPITMDHTVLAAIGVKARPLPPGVSLWTLPVQHPRIKPEETALDCNACHANQDPHRTLFGRDCASCHATSIAQGGWSIPEFRHPSPLSTDCSQCHQAPPSHYMEHFSMVSMKTAGVERADVSQCFLCHQTNAWNDIKGVGWYKHH
jgi:hypothetical protein